jgi:hypothetical protein
MALANEPEWRIYYDNGSTFDSGDGPWSEAPVDGVICIAVKDREKIKFYSGADYYWRFKDGSIADTSDLGPLLRTLGVIKFGRFTSNRNHERVMQRARDEWKA